MRTLLPFLLLATSVVADPVPDSPVPIAPGPGADPIEPPPALKEHTVLLVTSPELVDAWKPFAEWKATQGKPTLILTTKQIAADYKGVDLQEKIRQCVRDHIDNRGIRWVIIGGDSQPGGKGQVPDRDTVHQAFGMQNKHIPTDLYFISPTNWDADGDGIYGEFKDDHAAISYPDGKIGLGRIPMRTAADVAAYTAKVRSYESAYPKGSFADTMVYTCTVPGAYAKVRRSWDDYVSKALPKGTMHRYFSNKTPWDGDKAGDHDLTPKNWVELFNGKTAGKLHLHGHGLFECWVLEQHKMFTAKHVAKLTNEDAYPIITTVSCFTGQFDGAKDPCVTEAMLRQPKAGAIAIVAPCREGKPHFLNPREDFRLMVQDGKLDGTTMTMTLFWQHGIGESLTTGEAIMKAKADLAEKAKKSASFHMCLSELNLLGDPTLAVHPKNKRAPR